MIFALPVGLFWLLVGSFGWGMADFGAIGELSPYIPPAGYGGEGKEKKD